MNSTLEEIRDSVNNTEGVLTLPMSDVRDAHGAGRLGVHVRTNISKKLRSMGLDHYPKELPSWQDGLVRIYRQGSPIADLIEAVLDPSDEHDEELRNAVGGDAQEVLDAIRELVE